MNQPITTPRFMEAMDFLQAIDENMLKICICGKVFNSFFGEYDTCLECEKSINEQKEMMEELENA